MKVAWFVIILLIQVSFTQSRMPESGIVFNKERINAVILACDTLEITGIYYFFNCDSAPVSTRIFYPFPIDSNHDFPCSIQLFHSCSRKDTTYTLFPDGIGWNLSLVPGAADSVKVIYRQKIHRLQALYILTTTKFWNKPFDSAEYSVTASPGITLEYWSFQMDSVFEKSGKVTYVTKKQVFMPEGDMIMRWLCTPEKRKKKF